MSKQIWFIGDKPAGGFTQDPRQAMKVLGHPVVTPGITRSIELQVGKRREILWDELLDQMETCYDDAENNNDQGIVMKNLGVQYGLINALSIMVYGDTEQEHLESIANVATERYDKEVGDA